MMMSRITGDLDMKKVCDSPGAEILMADEIPARAVAQIPGAGLLGNEVKSVEMPHLENDPFDANFVLSGDLVHRMGDVQWNVGVSEKGALIAVAAFSESLAGPDLQYYNLTLDLVFVRPDRRGEGIGKSLVKMMGEIFSERVSTIGSVQPERSYMSCEPVSDGGEALAEIMNETRTGILSGLNYGSPVPG